MESYKERIKRK